MYLFVSFMGTTRMPAGKPSLASAHLSPEQRVCIRRLTCKYSLYCMNMRRICKTKPNPNHAQTTFATSVSS